MSTTDQTAQQVYDSANGFEDIGVKKAFGANLLALKDDPMTFGRALAFLVVKREGKNDMEAKTAALGLSNAELNEFFAEAAEASEEEQAAALAAAKAEARSMAEFCIRTGQSKDTYLSLTVLEREAFIEVHNEDNGE